MTLRIAALLVAWSLLAPSAARCPAQELQSFPDSAITNAQWQQRVQEARRRSEEFVANARAKMAEAPPSSKEEAAAADLRALNDPSLQPGDIIATSQGFLVFVGRDNEQRKPEDFLPAPASAASK